MNSIIIFAQIMTNIGGIIMGKGAIAGFYITWIIIGGIGALIYAMGLSTYKEYYLDNPTTAMQGSNAMTAGILILVVGSVFGLVAWIAALINLSKGKEWAWFILMFFFSGIMLLVYLIGGPPIPGSQQYMIRMQQQWPNYPPPPYYHPGQPSQSISALEILQQRYARGEIDAATYDQMRNRLKV